MLRWRPHRQPLPWGLTRRRAGFFRVLTRRWAAGSAEVVGVDLADLNDPDPVAEVEAERADLNEPDRAETEDAGERTDVGKAADELLEDADRMDACGVKRS